MTLRPDARAQLHQLLRRTMDTNNGEVPTAVRRSAATAFNISRRTLCRQITAVRDEAVDASPQGWWSEEATRDHVLAAVAATDSIKQAWTRLHGDGTLSVSYAQFTRHLHRHVRPAVRAALTGNGREDYLYSSIYCTDDVPQRNRRWQADAQEVPVWVLPDHGGAPFKPYQVTFIDEATRMVMATVLVAGRPNADDVVAALAAGVRGHTALDGTYVGGIPDTVRWDNGREFLNDAVTTACARLGIGPRPASPHAGWHKGKIERWHQTSQNELYSELPGASDGPLSFTGRQPWRGEDTGLLTFTGLTMRVLEWVTEYNHDRVHSALNTTPFEAWRHDTAPVTTATPAQLHPLMLALPRPRTVNKDGISYKGVKFQHPALGRYRGRKVSVRVLPHDYATIAVFDGDTFICDAVRAANLPAEQRRALVRQRHADYQRIKAAHTRAANRRAHEAVIRGLTDATPARVGVPQRADEVVADDDALLTLLGEGPA